MSLHTRRPPAPDLRVILVNAPGTAQSGQSVNVSWTVLNAGPGTLSGATWRDSIYLLPSTDQQRALFSRVRLHEAILCQSAATILATGQITLPYVFSGNYYVQVQADSANNVTEANEFNNSLVSTSPIVVTQAPLPDLQITSVSAPAFGVEGQKRDCELDGRQQRERANSRTLMVGLHLSFPRPGFRIRRTVQLGYLTHNGVLTSGQSYSQSLSVQLPRGISGPYYIFVYTDARNAVTELKEANNSGYSTQPIQINLQPLSDLTVTSVAVPTSATPGKPATFTWTVANQGSNSASGTWSDSVYVSTNQTWDINAFQVGKVSHTGPLQPGESYTASLTATVPGVVSGQYYAIVRADILNNVRESDENNNTGVSAQTVPVDVTELTLGQAYPSQLNQGTEDYYKVNVPSNQVMSVILNAAETNGFNELFTRFGAVPNRGEYDFLYDLPFEPDQQIVVPQTQPGFYYHLARGEYVPQTAFGNIQSKPNSCRSV